jgi:hypothetical protein
MAKIVFFRPKFGKLSAIEMTLLHLHDLSTCLKSTYFAVLFIYLFIYLFQSVEHGEFLFLFFQFCDVAKLAIMHKKN